MQLAPHHRATGIKILIWLHKSGGATKDQIIRATGDFSACQSVSA